MPDLDSYAAKLWDYWERRLDPDLFRDHSFAHAVNGKVVMPVDGLLEIVDHLLRSRKAGCSLLRIIHCPGG